MTENEINSSIIKELSELNIPIYYIFNQASTPAPYVTFNYIIFEDYYCNDITVYCTALVTLNLVVSTIQYDELKRYHQIIKNAGYKKAIKYYDNVARVYVLAFQKEVLVWEQN